MSKRRGFTLIELLVVIAIIGILGSLSWAALTRARQNANAVNTKTAIDKLHSQIQAKWDGYRTRKVPIDPRALLRTLQDTAILGTPHSYQADNAQAFISQLWAQRGSAPNDPLNAPYLVPNPNAPPPMKRNPQYPSIAQVAAVRLLAMRELQRYEMPCRWGDLVAVDAQGNPTGAPGNFQVLQPYVLASPPSLAYTYVRKLNAAAANPSITTAQIGQFDAAECLYMVVTSGLEDVSFGGELSSPKSVGDADGDGLPEFQDAWTLGLQSFPTAGPQRQPISWIRWPAGFRNSATITVSDLDPDPTAPNAGGPHCMQFSIADHDYFDTLKLDVPPQAGPPRGYGMMPLVFSVGPDGDAGLSPVAAGPSLDAWGVDPYIVDAGNNMAGAPSGIGWQDNIHNHLIEAR